MNSNSTCKSEKKAPKRNRSRIIRIPVNDEEGACIDKEYQRGLRGFDARMRRQLLAPITSMNLEVDWKKATYLARLNCLHSELIDFLKADKTGADFDMLIVIFLLATILEEARTNAF